MGNDQALWAFFVATSLGLTILILALVAAISISQHRVLKLHRDFSRSLLAAQDGERAWVAREVHDDVMQRVAVFRHELARWEAEATGLSETQRRRMLGLEAELEDLSATLQNLAHRLHPSGLDHGNLEVVLRQLAEECARGFGLQVDLELPTLQPLRAPERILAIYRICQEALRNVSRHAGVARARLKITTQKGALVVTVEDQGRGFDADHHPTGIGGGLGLLTMRERAALVGGTTRVYSRAGGGTVVRATIPLDLDSDGQDPAATG